MWTATNTDNTMCLASDICPFTASQKLQAKLAKIEKWLQIWCVHVTFTLRRGECALLTVGGEPLPSKDWVKYLSVHLEKQLMWAQHKNKK